MNSLQHIATLMQYRDVNGMWHARAVGCQLWAHADTPEEALERALALAVPHRTDDQPLRRRAARKRLGTLWD